MPLSTSRKKLIRYLLALTTLAGLLSISGCFPSDDGGNNNGGEYDSLHIPRALLRDTGATVYLENCTGCHGGEGGGDRGPQLRNSSFIMDNRELAVALILRGNQVNPPTVDSVWVNGVLYLAGGMPEHGSFLSNHQVAGLITFIRSVWNDTLVTNCDPNNLDPNNFPVCVRTPRTAAAMDLDSVAVWEVKAIRDTLPPIIE